MWGELQEVNRRWGGRGVGTAAIVAEICSCCCCVCTPGVVCQMAGMLRHGSHLQVAPALMSFGQTGNKRVAITSTAAANHLLHCLAAASNGRYLNPEHLPATADDLAAADNPKPLTFCTQPRFNLYTIQLSTHPHSDPVTTMCIYTCTLLPGILTCAANSARAYASSSVTCPSSANMLNSRLLKCAAINPEGSSLQNKMLGTPLVRNSSATAGASSNKGKAQG